MIIRLPPDKSLYGFMSKNSLISIVSCLIGSFFKSMSRPIPEASAISQNAPKMPPCEASWIAATPAPIADAASIAVEIWSIYAADLSINALENLVSSSALFSFARIAVPSSPT